MRGELAASGREPTSHGDTWQLAVRLGVFPIDVPSPCHGFQNGCVCTECLERVRLSHEKRVEPVQPWDARPIVAA